MSGSENKSSEFGLLFWVVTALIGGFLVWAAIPNFIGPRRSGPAWERHLCIDNLRQIDGAISEWALVKGKTNGTVITWNDIKPYYDLSKPDSEKQWPKCPSGGKYILGIVGIYPQVACSFNKTNITLPHVLP